MNNNYKIPHDSTTLPYLNALKHILESNRLLQEENDKLKAQMNISKKESEKQDKKDPSFVFIVTIPEKKEAVLKLITQSIQGRTGNREIMKPIVAAHVVGAISKPIYKNFTAVYGSLVTKPTFNRYIAGGKDNYNGDESFNVLMKEFNKIINS